MANFDSVARLYALLEYAAFGDTLQRARLAHIDLLAKFEPARFLLTGEGDGRFFEQLAKSHPASEFTLIDSSPRMLKLIRQRLRKIPETPMVQLFETNILSPDSSHDPPPQYEAVISHFFLDCFTAAEIEIIAQKISRRLVPRGLWIVTDFQNPSRLRHKLLLRIMYRFFRHTADLRVQNLPDYATILAAQGFFPIAESTFQTGFIKSTAYQFPQS